jgi:hypothetical protein
MISSKRPRNDQVYNPAEEVFAINVLKNRLLAAHYANLMNQNIKNIFANSNLTECILYYKLDQLTGPLIYTKIQIPGLVQEIKVFGKTINSDKPVFIEDFYTPGFHYPRMKYSKTLDLELKQHFLVYTRVRQLYNILQPYRRLKDGKYKYPLGNFELSIDVDVVDQDSLKVRICPMGSTMFICNMSVHKQKDGDHASVSVVERTSFIKAINELKKHINTIPMGP